MLKNKYVKLLILVFCMIFVIMSITTSIMAGNVLHTQHCHNEHCTICNLIQISTGFVDIIDITLVDILIMVASISLMQVIEKNIKYAKRLTLVELKVVQIK